MTLVPGELPEGVQDATPEAADGPLQGYLVVDLSRHLPGPFAARMLANLGARVIKIEEPEMGDPVRAAPPFRSGRSVLAESLLSGVESVALDLKKEGAREVVQRLLESADVLLETFRPGKLERFGLAPETLRQTKPRLVTCSLSGWGASGPVAGRSGHDLTYQAMAGSLAATGLMPNLPAADLMGAWSAVAAVCAALLRRQRTGAGGWIDASLFDAAVVGNVTNIASPAAGPTAIPNPGPLTGGLPCYRIYQTRDRRLFAVAALEERFWRRFCRAVGRSDLLPLQYRQRPEAHERVGQVMGERSADEWAELFQQHDLPGEVVLASDDALASQQARARELSGTAEGGLAFPAVIDGRRPRAASGLPRIGEQTRAVLEEFHPDALRMPRRERLASGIGPRLSLRRSLRGWLESLQSRGLR